VSPPVRAATLLAAVVATLLAAGLAARSATQALQQVHPRRTRVSDADRARALADLPALQDVAFTTSDGLTLRGWFAPGTRRAAVIFVHGLGGNRLTLLPEARVFASHGYGVLLYDSRASGESEGTLATWGDREQLDLRAAVDFVASRPDVDPGRIAALGFSVGGSTVALGSAADPRIHAVILHATWTCLHDEMKAKYGRYGLLSWGPALVAMRLAGVQPNNVRVLDHIRAISPRPLLMIAGASDDDTPVAVMRRVFEAAGPPKQLWVVPGAGHGGVFAAAPREYEQQAVPFLNRALFGETP
jgi:dienelactone hydrolase